MTMKAARKICKLQGIKFKKEVKVICPSCGRKTLILNITDDEAYCIRCNKHYKSVSEVERIEEEKWHDKHKCYEYIIQERSSAQK
ncbi:MAG: hypothetical protein ACOCP4_06920 [Candidatus Woesearchaeota archaeon]